MWPLSESQGRFGQLVVLALWVMPTEGMSTQNTQLHSQHLGKDSNGLQRYTKLQGYGDTSLSTVGSFALYYTPAEEPITSGESTPEFQQQKRVNAISVESPVSDALCGF